MKKLTTRQKFEKWAKRQGIALERMQGVSRNGPFWTYATFAAQITWRAFQAGRRSK